MGCGRPLNRYAVSRRLTFIVSELIMSDYPIEESGAIFREIAQAYGEEPITDADIIERLLSDLQTRLGPWVIVDFLDTSNWDKIESFEFDRNIGLLTLIWHDYRDAEETQKEHELRSMFFPAAVYACALQINSVVPVAGKSSGVFLINGYSKTQKEIKSLYRERSDELEVIDNSFFEKRVLSRKANDTWVIDFHCTPIFSLAIIPKQAGISSGKSKQILYGYNFSTALNRIRGVIEELEELDQSQADTISEKVNTIRRIMEFVLKVECCSRGLEIKKPYSQVLLGDLVSLIKPHHEEKMKPFLGRFAGIANEFSHDTGKPIELDKAKLVGYLALAYTRLLELDNLP